MKILIEVFRGIISTVKASGDDVKVTILDRDNLTEPCTVSTLTPGKASEEEIGALVTEALNEIDAAMRAREEQQKAQQAKRIAELWSDANVQFARLLSELKGVGLEPSQMRQLGASMDLTKEELHQLLDRAEEAHSVTIKELGLGPPDVDGG